MEDRQQDLVDDSSPTSLPPPHSSDGPMVTGVVQWDWLPTSEHGEGYLALRAGDSMVITDRGHEDWWSGYAEGDGDSVEGLFPAAYVQATDAGAVPAESAAAASAVAGTSVAEDTPSEQAHDDVVRAGEDDEVPSQTLGERYDLDAAGTDEAGTKRI